MRKTFLATVAAAALIPAFAMAQTTAPSSPSGTMPPAATSTMPATGSSATMTNRQTVGASGQMQASKFIGLDVYNSQNEKVGDIKELMLDASGRIDTVAIGVGGFLGMGTHNVAVKFDQLKWMNEPVRSASNATTNATTPATTSSSSTAMTARAEVKKNYPDHAVLDMSKDQLKALPSFDYTQ